MSKKRNALAHMFSNDRAAILTILAVAAILALSLFAIERIAGVPVSVRGQETYTQKTIRPARQPAARKPSQASKRKAARSRASGSSRSRISTIQNVCGDASCADLIARFARGDPACMRLTQCVDVLYRKISDRACAGTRDCRRMINLYGFFYANQACIGEGASCATQVEDVIQSTR